MNQNYQSQAYPTPPPKKRPIWPWILLVGVALTVALLVWAVNSGQRQLAEAEPVADYSLPYVAVVYAEGTMYQDNTDIYTGNSYDHQYLLDTFAELAADEMNRGVLLYIDSPGGEVMAASELGDAILEYKQASGRPVYAYGHDYAASGGYWIAAPADEFYVNRYCVTGSIGVTYGTFIDFSGLLEEYGVKTTTITSGAQKSMGSSMEPMSEETRAIFQTIIDEYYGYFIDWISAQRGISRAALLPLADGRIYTATQAVANGLADQVGDYDDCLEALLAVCGEECQVYDYYPSTSVNFSDLLRWLNQAQSEAAAVAELLPPTGVLAYYSEVRD